MPTLVVANRKGGSGKTTLALVFADRVLDAGGRVAILEGDPNKPLLKWAAGREDCAAIDASDVLGSKAGSFSAGAAGSIIEEAGKGKRCVVVADDNEETMLDWLEALKAFGQFVICDPEGSPNAWMTAAISQADLVLVPFAPTALDANQVAATIQALRHTMRVTGRQIPFKTVLTKTNPIPTKDERIIREKIAAGGVPLLQTYLQDRPAFRAMFRLDALLSDLRDSEVNGLEKARANAALFANEVLEVLRNQQEKAA